jgi:hypothetical protein
LNYKLFFVSFFLLFSSNSRLEANTNKEYLKNLRNFKIKEYIENLNKPTSQVQFTADRFIHPVKEDSPPQLHTTPNSLEDRPPYYFWIALGLAVSTFLWNIYIFFFNKKSKKLEVVDEYWVRNIAFPICITPLVGFIEKYAKKSKRINKLNKKNKLKKIKLESFLDDFKDDKEFIIKKSYVLTYKWRDIYLILSKLLDELDDEITFCCYEILNNLKNENGETEARLISEDSLYTKLGEILSALSSLHSSNI